MCSTSYTTGLSRFQRQFVSTRGTLPSAACGEPIDKRETTAGAKRETTCRCQKRAIGCHISLSLSRRHEGSWTTRRNNRAPPTSILELARALQTRGRDRCEVQVYGSARLHGSTRVYTRRWWHCAVHWLVVLHIDVDRIPARLNRRPGGGEELEAVHVVQLNPLRDFLHHVGGCTLVPAFAVIQQ